MKGTSDKTICSLMKTTSGKDVYDVKWHESYKYFSEEDHAEACDFHFDRWEKKWNELESIYSSSYMGHRRFENNRELNRLNDCWHEHNRLKLEMADKRKKNEKKIKRIERSKIPLIDHEKFIKKLKSDEAKERRNKIAAMSNEDRILIDQLKCRLNYMSDMHPQDSLRFGVSVSEQRRIIRNEINYIINKQIIKS